MKKHIFLLCLAAGSAQAGSYCELDGTEMFQCSFDAGAKRVEICDAVWLEGNQASYGFVSQANGVEKEIITDKASLHYRLWNGVGSYLGDSVTFWTEDGYGYEVYWSQERGSDTALEGGVLVHKGADVIARLECDPGSVQHDLDSLIEQIDLAQSSP